MLTSNNIGRRFLGTLIASIYGVVSPVANKAFDSGNVLKWTVDNETIGFVVYKDNKDSITITHFGVRKDKSLVNYRKMLSETVSHFYGKEIFIKVYKIHEGVTTALLTKLGFEYVITGHEIGLDDNFLICKRVKNYK